MMKMLSQSINNVHLVRLSGRFDARSTPEIQRQLTDILEHDVSRIIINMANVDFVDSTALSALVQARRMALRARGDLYLCELRQPVRIIFELTRLDRVFEIMPDESGAVMAFAARDETL